MDVKERWFDQVPEVHAKAKALWDNPIPRLKPEAVAEYEKYFEEKCSKSRELCKEAVDLIPGAVQHNLSLNHPFPVAMKKVEEAYFYDIDGNRYINYLQAGGPTMLGSNDPDVRAKVIELMNTDGAVTGLLSEHEVNLTKLVQKHIPHVEMMRMFASGSEADMAMARLCRAYTGKPNIIKQQGGYHGWNDTFEYDYGLAGSKDMLAVGVPASYRENISAVPINDIDALRRQFEENEKAGGTACFVMEPLGPDGGSKPVYYEYPQQVRELCDEFGALLVFDEVITAFRVALGSAAKILGVTPDLSVFGKVLTGSYPMAGGVGGRRDIMQHFAPPEGADYGKVHVGGTLSANPMSCVAGYYSLLKQEEIGGNDIAADAAEKLASGLKEIFAKYDLPFSAYAQPAIVHIDVTGILGIQITDDNKADIMAKYPERAKAMNEFGMALMAEGVVTLAGRRLYTCAATSDEVIADTLERFDRLFSNYEKA